MEPTRFATVYIVQGVMFLIYVFLAYKILKRDTKRLNVLFSGFYVSIAVGLFINFIYAPFGGADFVTYLNLMTNFALFFAVIFLVVFNLILLKSEKVITTPKQLVIIIGYALVLFIGLLTLTFIPGAGVSFSGPPNYSPIWALPYFFYLISVITIFSCGPSFYLLNKVYNKFEDDELKKKWRYFSLGVVFILAFGYLTSISNILNNSTFRSLNAVIGFVLVLSAAYLMYVGVGRQLSK